MNKKIISAAIAATFAVSGAVMADVTVSGHIEQGFATEATNGAGMSSISDNFFVIKADEDLGNGMKAFASMRIDADNNATHTPTVTDDATYVGLSGDFGTVMAGRFEAFIEGKMASTMSFQGLNSVEQSDANQGIHSNGLAYVSPSFNGLTIGAGGYIVPNATPLAAATDDVDATEIAIMYNNGPLSLAIAQQDVDNSVVTALGGAEKTLAFNAAYTMDNMKFTLYYEKGDDFGGVAADDRTDIGYRFDYTMGNNKISLGYLDDETTNGADGNDTTALELVHSFSKKTSAYVGWENYDSVAAGTEDDRMYVGLQHNF